MIQTVCLCDSALWYIFDIYCLIWCMRNCNICHSRSNHLNQLIKSIESNYYYIKSMSIIFIVIFHTLNLVLCFFLNACMCVCTRVNVSHLATWFKTKFASIFSEPQIQSPPQFSERTVNLETRRDELIILPCFVEGNPPPQFRYIT